MKECIDLCEQFGILGSLATVHLSVHFGLACAREARLVAVADILGVGLIGGECPPVEVPGLNREIEEKIDVFDHQECPETHPRPAGLAQRPYRHQRAIDHAERVNVREDAFFEDFAPRQIEQVQICQTVSDIERVFELAILTANIRTYLRHGLHAPELLSHVSRECYFAILDEVAGVGGDLLGEHGLRRFCSRWCN